jgi:hypothetical protein
MRSAGGSRVGLVLATALCASAIAAPAARAQGPEFVPLAQGSFPSLNSTWQALAIRSNTIFFDLYDDEGTLYYTYAPQFDQPPPKRLVTAISYRPFGLPTVATLVGGVAGKRVKTVKVFFDGAPMQKLRTVKAPPEWAFAARFFGTGANVAESSANKAQVVTLIKALDGKGRLLSKLTNVFTNPV